jgi:hypothetical protein
MSVGMSDKMAGCADCRAAGPIQVAGGAGVPADLGIFRQLIDGMIFAKAATSKL